MGLGFRHRAPLSRVGRTGYPAGMTLPFFGDPDPDEAQSFGNLIWTTIALEGLVNRVCRLLLGAQWREGQDVGRNISRAQAAAVARNNYAGHLAHEWLSEARPKLYLRNQVLHSTVAAHMDPADFGKVSFYSLHNVRWDAKSKTETQMFTEFTVANLEAIRAEVGAVIDGFGMIDLVLAG